MRLIRKVNPNLNTCPYAVSAMVPGAMQHHSTLVCTLHPLIRMSATVFVQPLDLVKNRMQLSGKI